jgi:hypothetical protein
MKENSKPSFHPGFVGQGVLNKDTQFGYIELDHPQKVLADFLKVNLWQSHNLMNSVLTFILVEMRYNHVVLNFCCLPGDIKCWSERLHDLSITTFSITTFNKTTLSIMAFSITIN